MLEGFWRFAIRCYPPMCGRSSLTSDLDRLLPRLQGPLPPGLLEHYAPRSQVRPAEPVLLQRWEHGGPQVALALWGLVPGWVKDPLAPGPDGRRRSRPINARGETVPDKPCCPPMAFMNGRSGGIPSAVGSGSSRGCSAAATDPPSGWGACGSAGSVPMAVSWRPP